MARGRPQGQLQAIVARDQRSLEQVLVGGAASAHLLGLGLGGGDVRAVTYEYGNTFLLVAGLLNYLAMLDAFDIAVGRKQ